MKHTINRNDYLALAQAYVDAAGIDIMKKHASGMGTMITIERFADELNKNHITELDKKLVHVIKHSIRKECSWIKPEQPSMEILALILEAWHRFDDDKPACFIAFLNPMIAWEFNRNVRANMMVFLNNIAKSTRKQLETVMPPDDDNVFNWKTGKFQKDVIKNHTRASIETLYYPVIHDFGMDAFKWIHDFNAMNAIRVMKTLKHGLKTGHGRSYVLKWTRGLLDGHGQDAFNAVMDYLDAASDTESIIEFDDALINHALENADYPVEFTREAVMLDSPASRELFTSEFIEIINMMKTHDDCFDNDLMGSIVSVIGSSKAAWIAGFPTTFRHKKRETLPDENACIDYVNALTMKMLRDNSELMHVMSAIPMEILTQSYSMPVSISSYASVYFHGGNGIMPTDFRMHTEYPTRNQLREFMTMVYANADTAYRYCIWRRLIDMYMANDLTSVFNGMTLNDLTGRKSGFIPAAEREWIQNGVIPERIIMKQDSYGRGTAHIPNELFSETMKLSIPMPVETLKVFNALPVSYDEFKEQHSTDDDVLIGIIDDIMRQSKGIRIVHD